MMLSAKRKNSLLKHYLKFSEISPNNVECSNCGAKNVPHKKYLLKDMTENKFIIDNTKKIFEDLQLREVYITGKMKVDDKEYDGEIPVRLVFNNVRIVLTNKDNIESEMSSWHTPNFLKAYVCEKYKLDMNLTSTPNSDELADYTDIKTYLKNYQQSPTITKGGGTATTISLEMHDIVTDIYNKHISNEQRNEFIFDQKESNRLLSKNWMEKNHQNLKLFCANCQ